MGLEGLAPKPRTTIHSKENRGYPYLLRGLDIAKPDPVWCSNITYIPMRQGYLYLCAVMDWHSGFVISWRLSNSLDTEFVLEALEEALEKGHPEKFNTDRNEYEIHHQLEDRKCPPSIFVWHFNYCRIRPSRSVPIHHTHIDIHLGSRRSFAFPSAHRPPSLPFRFARLGVQARRTENSRPLSRWHRCR